MAGISSYDSNSISTLFSSLGQNGGSIQGNNNFLGIDLKEYSNIRSGSYFKLMKSYYSKVAEESDGNKENPLTSTSTSADSTKTLANIESTASSLSESAKDLYSSGSKAFQKKTSTDETGKTVTGYDMEKLYDAVSAFASDYNSAIRAAGKSNTNKIANAASTMINNTNSNRKSLAAIGISIDSANYTLSIDKEKFMSAAGESVKSLFQGTGSYAYQTAVSASMLESYASIESSKSNTYSKGGAYSNNYTAGDLYNLQT